MTRPIVLFGCGHDVDQAAIDEVLTRLNALPAIITEVRDWAIHEDVGCRPGPARFALAATFDTMADVDNYLGTTAW